LKKNKFLAVIIVILLFWTGIILFLGSRGPVESYNQSGGVYSFLKKIDTVLDFTNNRFFLDFELFLKKLWFGTDKVSSMALLRKSAHFGIYFVLGIISFVFSLGYSKKYLMAVITGVTFPAFIACFDEYNQEFFERGAALTDVMIDISGAVAGTVLAVCVILVVKLILYIKRKNGQGEKKA